VNGPKCARDGFGSTLFELYFPFPRLPFIFLPRCQIPVINKVIKHPEKPSKLRLERFCRGARCPLNGL